MKFNDITAELLREMFEYRGGSLHNRTRRSRTALPGLRAGTPTAKGYRRVCVGGHYILEHRLVWLYMTGAWPAGQIDHINGDKTDNRMENLRDVSHHENHRNCKRPTNNSSGVAGVSWHPKRHKWRAYITIDKRQHSLGYHADKQAAAHARKEAEARFGFHANHGRAA